MKSKFEIEIEFKGHSLFVDGFYNDNGMRFYHIYLSGTEIEISDSLTQKQHDKLEELIIETIK